MKKILAIIFVFALVITCAGCTLGKTEADEEQQSVPSDISFKETAGFDEATHNLCVALSIGLRYTLDKNALDYPSALWDIFGWYCGYSAKNGGPDSLTEIQLSSLQYAIRPGKQPLSMPEGWDTAGYITTERTEAGYIYSFPTHVGNFEEYFGNLKFEIKDDEEKENTVNLTLTDKNDSDVKEEFSFTFAKDENAGKDFPYVLKSFVIPVYEGAKEPEDTDDEDSREDGKDKEDEICTIFNYRDLVESNLISKLLDSYTCVSYKEIMDEKTMGRTCYFRDEGINCIASEFTGGDGGKEKSGAYGNVYLYEDGDHYFTYNNPMMYEYDEGDYAFDYSIAGIFPYGEPINPEVTDEGIWFEIKTPYQDETDEDEETEKTKFLVDVDTLALKKMMHYSRGEEYFRWEFTYDGEIEDFGIFDSWNGDYREITVVEEFYTPDGEVADGAHTIRAPKNVEYYPVYDEEVCIYLSEGFRNEYSYPGNDIDYTIYVTNAKG